MWSLHDKQRTEADIQKHISIYTFESCTNKKPNHQTNLKKMKEQSELGYLKKIVANKFQESGANIKNYLCEQHVMSLSIAKRYYRELCTNVFAKT